MSNRFTEKAEKVLNGAATLAEAMGHTYIGSEHLLLSICNEKECNAATILAKRGVIFEKVSGIIKELSGVGAKSALTPRDMTPRTRKIVEGAYKISIRYGASKIGSDHLLLAILEEKECIGTRVLAILGADVTTITEDLITVLRTAEKHVEAPKGKKEAESPLTQYGKNLTDLARCGKLDPVIGRDGETDRVIRVLSRKNKNNPCLIGEAGVGKTAIVEGLAIRIAEGRVPEAISNKSIISVDLTSMVAGAKYRGDFEERIKNIINEAVKNKNVILFIDEIHTIVGAGSAEGAIDAANILKPQLSRAEIQLIGATTLSEYHKHIEKDAALERRFQSILVEEPDEKQTLGILRGVRERYEKHHNVRIDDEALSSAVKLAERYLQDRYFPDKALDIIDEACAKVGLKATIDNNSEKRYANFGQNNSLSDDCTMPISSVNASFAAERLKVEGKIKDIIPTVGAKDILEIVREMTGIDISGDFTSHDHKALKARLKELIYGQEEAIEGICKAVARSKAGLNDPDRPKGVFLFTGPSGVGKTEISKLLSEELFGDKKALIRYDMSEFSEKNSVTMLIGSPPGYVGYEEGGSLTEKVRRHPYSVILFDEIEKAHKDVMNLFLQIMDDGVLTDSCGRKVNFKNSYIIMTSNITGSGAVLDEVGFITRKEEADKKLLEAFSPEFLNRIDHIIRFNSLDVETVCKICKRKLNILSERLSSIGIKLNYSDETINYFAEKATDRRFGARTVMRMITREIEDNISELMLEGELEQISIKLEDGAVKLVPLYRIKK